MRTMGTAVRNPPPLPDHTALQTVKQQPTARNNNLPSFLILMPNLHPQLRRKSPLHSSTNSLSTLLLTPLLLNLKTMKEANLQPLKD
jgi:hypothetical protein